MRRPLLPFLIVLFYAGTAFPQTYERLEVLAKDYFLLLGEHSNSARFYLDSLDAELHDTGAEHSNDSLLIELKRYQKELNNISSDSALFLFNRWYLQLSSMHYDYAKEKFFASGKKKILLFSTSMSCYCTLKMCQKQTLEVMEFAGKADIDYWVIDSYEHNELQIRHDALFAPSVLLFDSENNLLAKIEYDEQMIDKLKSLRIQK